MADGWRPTAYGSRRGETSAAGTGAARPSLQVGDGRATMSDEREAMNDEHEHRARTVGLAGCFRLPRYVVYCISPRPAKCVLACSFLIL